jgi:hypothetical protein
MKDKLEPVIGARLFRALALLAIAALCCTGCAHVREAPYTPKPAGQWADAVMPLDLRISHALTPCEIAGVQAAAEWWDSMAGRRMFIAHVVPADDAAVLGLPAYGQIGVTTGAMERPDVLDETVLTWVAGSTTMLHSATTVIRGCSVQAFTHELGHVLGLAHREQGGALMQVVHHPDAWGLTSGELDLVRGPQVPW